MPDCDHAFPTVFIVLVSVLAGVALLALFTEPPIISICNSTIVERPVEKTVLQYMSLETCQERILENLEKEERFREQLNTTLHKS